MKKFTLALGMAVLAAISAFAFGNRSFTAPAKLTGLFGVKFGDRMPSDKASIPSPDGTLLVVLEPKTPEFEFENYFACIHAQTRSVLGMCGINTYERDRLSTCNAAYSRTKRLIERRLGIYLEETGPVESGVGDAQVVVKSCATILSENIVVGLQTLKDQGGNLSLRFIALDLKGSQETLQKSEETAKNVSPLNGLFGRTLGQVARVSSDEIALSGGICLQAFVPDKKFLDFDTYAVHILPKSRKICAIVAVCDFKERFSATECYEKSCKLLEKKFGLTMSDLSASFNSSTPDEDGEIMLKCAAMSFPNSLRYVEVDCFKDVDDNVFRVRISASDEALVGLQETESRDRKQDSAEQDALDAL
ncbi:MAG: hypothetical protein IJQ34_04495 [Kiritimatiellae bacterium]|nr:hypothetical protein [Kiritimatiellia bacterium]